MRKCERTVRSTGARKDYQLRNTAFFTREDSWARARTVGRVKTRTTPRSCIAKAMPLGNAMKRRKANQWIASALSQILLGYGELGKSTPIIGPVKTKDCAVSPVSVDEVSGQQGRVNHTYATNRCHFIAGMRSAA